MAETPGPASAEVSGALTAADLRAECDTILRAIVAEGGTREAAEAHAPGTANNVDAGVRGWLRYYQQLHRMHAVLVHAGAGGARDDVALERAMADALAERSVRVLFADGTARNVYPKSYHALAWLDSLDRMHKLDAAVLAGIAELPDASREELAAHALAPLGSSLARRIWLWILTTEGPGLPFDERLETVDPPAFTTTVTPEDIVHVFEGHVEVNRRRLAIMAHAFPPEGGGTSSLPLAGFIGAMAHESGRDARELMRAHSLGKLYAEAISAAVAVRDARKRAEAGREAA